MAFWGVHVAAVIGVIALGWSWQGAALALGSYFVRMVVVTAAYHRYFAHRAFKTSRAFQFLLALGAQSAAQKGVLWWASHHRWHHKYSDTPEGRPLGELRGFWYSHIGWIMGPEWERHGSRRWSPTWRSFPSCACSTVPRCTSCPRSRWRSPSLFLGGAHGLVWGYFVSTVLLWHGSFSINSLAHLFGKRRYATTDDSRNNWALALLTTGEGWHNNHHHYQSSANQGFRWWEIDVTYYVLRLLERSASIWDLRRPPREVVGSADCRSRGSARVAA